MLNEFGLSGLLSGGFEETDMSKNCDRGSKDFQIFGSQIVVSYNFKAKEIEPLLLLG